MPYYILVAPETTFLAGASSISGLELIGLEDFYCSNY